MPDPTDTLARARAALQGGRPADAVVPLERLVPTIPPGPAHAEACRLLAQALMGVGKPAEALSHARAAATSDAGTDSRLLVANICWATGNAEEATEAARAGVRADPQRRDAHGTLANFLLRQERFADALDAADAALERFPGDLEFLSLRASMRLTIGRPEAAVADLRDALARSPGNMRILGALGPALNYVPDVPLAELRRVHEEFGKALLAALPARPAARTSTSDPERRLRVGLLSPDFRSHAVWHFVHPILAHLDRDAFDVHCYYTGGVADEGTELLRSLGRATWNHVPTLHVGHLADKIAADAIDILIDFAGHTRFNRLGTMALKPAPVQINFTGYPCTAGIPKIDYHLTDSFCSPPGLGHEGAFVERLLRCDPIFFAYQAWPGTPDVGPPPSEAAGVVTFGSFNTLMKLNDRVVAAWAGVVKAVPGSRLLVKNMQLRQPQARELTRRRFLDAGIPEACLEVIGHEGTVHDHMRTYHRVDVALDPFPYAGMTTTCESLLMGVPVVSLPSETFVSRVGPAILESVGLGHLVAKDVDDFVKIAATLAADLPQRRQLRATLRERLLASPVGDCPAYAERLGGCLRGAWRAHCARGNP
jgi:predicted O-linked N-acetylglucosamine transferase (SPINDLY family)